MKKKGLKEDHEKYNKTSRTNRSIEVHILIDNREEKIM